MEQAVLLNACLPEFIPNDYNHSVFTINNLQGFIEIDLSRSNRP